MFTPMVNVFLSAFELYAAYIIADNIFRTQKMTRVKISFNIVNISSNSLDA